MVAKIKLSENFDYSSIYIRRSSIFENTNVVTFSGRTRDIFDIDFCDWDPTGHNDNATRSTNWSTKGDYSIRLRSAMSWISGTSTICRLTKQIPSKYIMFDYTTDNTLQVYEDDVLIATYQGEQTDCYLEITFDSFIRFQSLVSSDPIISYIDNIRYQ